jgi:tRNA1Val (adenine37-N6)-methyltransferase
MPKNSYFRFKQFTVHQDRCAMKVSSDACVLGAQAARALARVHEGRAFRVLDIGAGTGLLSLMVAQANPGAQIDAVELDAAAAAQAQENCAASPWAARLRVDQADIKVVGLPPAGPYAAIVSNPPFFNQSLKSERGPARNWARHTDSLPYPVLWDAVDRLLAPAGLFYLLLPLPEAKIFAEMARSFGFGPVAQLLVQDSPTKLPHRVVLIFARSLSGQEAEALAPDTLIVRESTGQYSADFQALMGDYYE